MVSQERDGPPGDALVSLAPLEPRHTESLGLLRHAISSFLQRGHQQLLTQLTPLAVCPECVRMGARKALWPGSFSEMQLLAHEEEIVEVGSVSCVFPSLPFSPLRSCSALGATRICKWRTCCAGPRTSQSLKARIVAFAVPCSPPAHFPCLVQRGRLHGDAERALQVHLLLKLPHKSSRSFLVSDPFFSFLHVPQSLMVSSPLQGTGWWFLHGKCIQEARRTSW